MGTSGTCWRGFRKVQSLCDLPEASRDSFAVAAWVKVPSGVEAGTSGFLSSADMDLGVPLEFPEGSQASSNVETQVRFPLELEKQFQDSCRFVIGICDFPSRCPRAVTPAIMF